MQKLISVGNSKAITIPKDILNDVGDVDMVKVKYDNNKKRLTIDFSEEEVVGQIVDKEVYGVAKNLVKRYGKALKELAGK